MNAIDDVYQRYPHCEEWSEQSFLGPLHEEARLEMSGYFLCRVKGQAGPQESQAIAQHLGFEDVGNRMLVAWAEGVRGLCDQSISTLGNWTSSAAFEDFSPPKKLKTTSKKIGYPTPRSTSTLM